MTFPDDLADGKPRLALIAHDALEVGSDIQQIPDLIKRIFERKGSEGTGLRAYRNNLVFLLADQSKSADMRRSVARRLALLELRRPERLGELADHQQAKVLELERKAEHNAAIAIQQCFRHILHPSKVGLEGAGGTQLAHAVIDVQNASEKPGSGQLQVIRQLQSHGKLRDAHDQPESPSFIRDRTPLKRGQITTGALRDEFRKDPALSIHLGDDVLRKAINIGIADGLYVYRYEELLAGPGDPLPSIRIDEQSSVFTMEYAKEKGIWPRLESREEPEQSARQESDSASIDGEPAVSSSSEVDGATAANVTPGDPANGQDGARSFVAEGVLKEALLKVFEQARSAKIERISRITIRLFDYGDAFKLVPVAQAVPGAKAHVKLDGSFQTTGRQHNGVRLRRVRQGCGRDQGISGALFSSGQGPRSQDEHRLPYRGWSGTFRSGLRDLYRASDQIRQRRRLCPRRRRRPRDGSG